MDEQDNQTITSLRLQRRRYKTLKRWAFKWYRVCEERLLEIEALEEMIVRQRKHIMQLQGKIEQSKHEQVRKRKPPFVTFGEVVRDERGVWKTRVQEQPGPRAP